MRSIVSTAIVALIVGSLAGATVSTLAQTEPSDERVVAPAAKAGNADKVDGKHAVGAGASRVKRANRLVATNKQGYLPSNIVKPRWPLIQGMPAGFADGIDDKGVTSVAIKSIRAEKSIPPNSGDWAIASCPNGWTAVGGGYGTHPDIVVRDSKPHTTYNDIWAVSGHNYSATTSHVLEAFVVCVRVTGGGGSIL